MVGLLIFTLLFSNRTIYNNLAWYWQAPIQYPNIKGRFEAGILLTGVTFTNNNNQSFFGGSADRFIQALKVYKKGFISKLIISGGTATLSGDRPSEAKFLANELMEVGVPTNNIITESNSRNTYENAVYCKKLLDSLQIETPVLLITSAMHAKRAIACFEKQNIPVIFWPSNISIASNDFSWKQTLIPDLTVLLEWQALNKEMVGYAAYAITGKL